MAIHIEKIDHDVTAIVLDEKFDFEAVGSFRQAYENLEDITNKTVVVDFRNTRYIDSSALGMLINAKNYLDKMGEKIKIINTSDQVKKIFSISRFDKKFDIS